jgi:hypothetical protein
MSGARSVLEEFDEPPDVAPLPCLIRGCVALVEPGSVLCTVHGKVTVRTDLDVPIHCNACGKLIRIGARWVVREVGAFHCRATCLNAAPDTWEIPV